MDMYQLDNMYGITMLVLLLGNFHCALLHSLSCLRYLLSGLVDKAFVPVRVNEEGEI